MFGELKMKRLLWNLWCYKYNPSYIIIQGVYLEYNHSYMSPNDHKMWDWTLWDWKMLGIDAYIAY